MRLGLPTAQTHCRCLRSAEQNKPETHWERKRLRGRPCSRREHKMAGASKGGSVRACVRACVRVCIWEATALAECLYAYFWRYSVTQFVCT